MLNVAMHHNGRFHQLLFGLDHETIMQLQVDTMLKWPSNETQPTITFQLDLPFDVVSDNAEHWALLNAAFPNNKVYVVASAVENHPFQLIERYLCLRGNLTGSTVGVSIKLLDDGAATMLVDEHQLEQWVAANEQSRTQPA